MQIHNKLRAAQQLPPRSDALQPRWEDWYALARELRRKIAPGAGGSTLYPSVFRPAGETPRHTADSLPQQPFQQVQQGPGPDTRWSHQPSSQEPQRPLPQMMQPLAQQAREQAADRLSQPVPMPEASSTPTGPPHPIQSTMPPQRDTPQPAGHDLLLNKSTRPLSAAAYQVLRPFEAMFQLQDLALSHPKLMIHHLLIITTRPEGCELALECLRWKSLRRRNIPELAQFANVAEQYRQETLMLLRAYGGLDFYMNSTSEEVDYQMGFWRHKKGRGRHHPRAHLAPVGDAVQEDQQVLPWQPPVQPVSDQTGQESARPSRSAFNQQQAPQAISPPPSRDTSEPSSASQRSIHGLDHTCHSNRQFPSDLMRRKAPSPNERNPILRNGNKSIHPPRKTVLLSPVNEAALSSSSKRTKFRDPVIHQNGRQLVGIPNQTSEPPQVDQT